MILKRHEIRRWNKYYFSFISVLSFSHFMDVNNCLCFNIQDADARL